MDSLEILERDRQALEEMGGPLDDAPNPLPEKRKCGENVLPRKGLAFAECYIEGRLCVVLEYHGCAERNSTAVIERYAVEFDADVPSIDPSGDHGFNNSWQDALMLVCDVEVVEIVKAMLPTRERLHLIPDVVDDGSRRTVPLRYLALDGGFYVLPWISEGKARPLRRDMPIGFDKDAVCVIKGGPHVVQCISQHSRSMFGRLCEKDRDTPFERALLVIGGKSLTVFRDVSSEKPFKLVNVMIGPFQFQ